MPLFTSSGFNRGFQSAFEQQLRNAVRKRIADQQAQLQRDRLEFAKNRARLQDERAARLDEERALDRLARDEDRVFSRLQSERSELRALRQEERQLARDNMFAKAFGVDLQGKKLSNERTRQIIDEFAATADSRRRKSDADARIAEVQAGSIQEITHNKVRESALRLTQAQGDAKIQAEALAEHQRDRENLSKAVEATVPSELKSRLLEIDKDFFKNMSPQAAQMISRIADQHRRLDADSSAARAKLESTFFKGLDSHVRKNVASQVKLIIDEKNRARRDDPDLPPFTINDLTAADKLRIFGNVKEDARRFGDVSQRLRLGMKAFGPIDDLGELASGAIAGELALTLGEDSEGNALNEESFLKLKIFEEAKAAAAEAEEQARRDAEPGLVDKMFHVSPAGTVLRGARVAGSGAREAATSALERFFGGLRGGNIAR